jgi:2-polyprenyl-6-hydroxyphenyl methylase/3-demethylubiquinone-9 3-methyltransferase
LAAHFFRFSGGKMSIELDATTYIHAKPATAHSYILPAVVDVLENSFQEARETAVFDLGCGTGGAAAVLAEKGYDVVGVDPSKDGIAKARTAHPDLPLEIGSGYEDLSCRYGSFDAVISLEVVEHVYVPKALSATM